MHANGNEEMKMIHCIIKFACTEWTHVPKSINAFKCNPNTFLVEFLIYITESILMEVE